ncbi:tRNA (guanosine(46)-N7)-methyltransferase TrmB [Verrucomicrobiota bacterium]
MNHQNSTSIISPESWTQLLSLEEIFNPGKPLEIDLGCGKGRFLVARAKSYTEINFLGIDRLLVRLRKVNKKIIREGLNNVKLLRIEASYAVKHLLPPETVSSFYIFFPDPWPKKRHHKRRLFTSSFLDALYRTLKSSGHIHIATDNLNYFEEICDLFGKDPRFKTEPPFEPNDEEKTNFELIFTEQNAPIGRCSFSKNSPAN